MIRTKIDYKMWSYELVDFEKKGTFVRGNASPGEIAPYVSVDALITLILKLISFFSAGFFLFGFIHFNIYMLTNLIHCFSDLFLIIFKLFDFVADRVSCSLLKQPN